MNNSNVDGGENVCSGSERFQRNHSNQESEIKDGVHEFPWRSSMEFQEFLHFVQRTERSVIINISLF
jgi:hypothetical protein